MTSQIDPSAFAAVIADFERRLVESRQNEQRIIHERDGLLDKLDRRAVQKIWPVHVKCDSKGCSSVVAFDPAPEEARLAGALVALGWSCEAGHICPRCRR